MGEVEEGEIMLKLFLPTYHVSSDGETDWPTMTVIHHLVMCTLACFTCDLLRFLAATTNVRCDTTFAQRRAHFFIAFIQAYPLRPLVRRRWPRHDDARDLRTNQVHIVAIGAINRHTYGHAIPLGQHQPLGPTFPQLVGLGLVVPL